MEVSLALLADAANISREGKLNVLGAFTSIGASAFPARHPSMQLVLEMDASISEVGTVKKIEVKLLDQDGQMLGEVTGEIKVQRPAEPGQRVHFGMVIPLTDVVFLKAGRHVFDVLIDGISLRQVPLTITETKAGDTQ